MKRVFLAYVYVNFSSEIIFDKSALTVTVARLHHLGKPRDSAKSRIQEVPKSYQKSRYKEYPKILIE